jgi:hypothetical protein
MEIAMNIQAGDSLLVKASRAEGLDKLSQQLLDLITLRDTGEQA